MGKLKEFKADWKSVKENLNLISEKLVEFEPIKEDLSSMKAQFDIIFTQMTAEPTEAQVSCLLR